MSRVLITSGTTGGHFFPALCLAKELKTRQNEIYFLLSPKLKDWVRFLPDKTGVIFFSSQPLPQRFGLKTIIFVFSFAFGLMKSTFILRRLQPEKVVGVGSYLAAPLLFLCAFFKTPVLLHEQNFRPGRANLFLSRFAQRIAVGFAQTKDFFPKNVQDKVFFTGNPIRQEILGVQEKQAKDFFGLNQDLSTLLLIGGSQGAHFLNQILLKVLESLTKAEKAKIQIIHLSGKDDYAWVNSRYGQLEIRANVYSFLDNIGLALKIADLVLARAGALTISEILACGRASILIPYAYAGQHQKANAQFLAENGAAIVLKEEGLSPSLLKENLLRLIQEENLRKKMADNALKLAKIDATERLAREVYLLK